MKLILGRKEYLKAVDKDYQVSIQLDDTKNFYQNSIISKTINELKQFNLERNEAKDYLLYGKIETLADDLAGDSYNLNTNNYTISVGYIDQLLPVESDMIIIKSVSSDSVLVDTKFQINDVVLIYRLGKFTTNRVLGVQEINKTFKLKLDSIDGITSNHKIVPSVCKYKRFFKEIYSTNYLKVYNSAYSTNIYGNQIFQFNTFKNINIEGLKNNFNIPITSLYLKAKPNSFKKYYDKEFGTEIVSDPELIDLVEFDLNTLTISKLKEISYVMNKDGVDLYIKPFMEFEFKITSEVVTDSNKDNLFDYPDYSFVFNNGDVIYKEILDIGYFENSNGMDYPFINKLHYLYKDIKFFVRRVVPLLTAADYKNLLPFNNDQFADDLVNDEVNTKRLC